MCLSRQVTTVGEQSSQGTMGIWAHFSCRSNPVKIQFHQHHQSTPWFPVPALFPSKRQPVWTPDICTDWWQKREEYDKSEKCDSQGAAASAASPDPRSNTWVPGPSPPAHLQSEGTHLLCITLPSCFFGFLVLCQHWHFSTVTLSTLRTDPAHVNKRWASWAAGYFYTFSN